MALVIAAGIVGWQMFINKESGAISLNAPVTETSSLARGVSSAPPARSVSSAPPAGNVSKMAKAESSAYRLVSVIEGLNARMKQLTDSINTLESKLTRAHVITDSIVEAGQTMASSTTRAKPGVAGAARDLEALPPPAAGQLATDADPVAARGKGAAPAGIRPGDSKASTASPAPEKAVAPQSVVTAMPASPATTKRDAEPAANQPSNTPGTGSVASAKTALPEPVKPMDTRRAASGAAKDGPWVINLLSSPSRADADRFAAKAWSRGITTHLQEAVVKGKRYWRVQITGFASAGEARAHADSAREKLGLKDVWIMTR